MSFAVFLSFARKQEKYVSRRILAWCRAEPPVSPVAVEVHSLAPTKRWAGTFFSFRETAAVPRYLSHSIILQS